MTTLDSRVQRLAETAVRAALDGPGRMQGVGQAALVAMRPDGSVVAMVGGRDYRTSQFNRAVQAHRQPGSAFKLFVYLAALRDGATPDSLVSEAPVRVGDWSPKNFEGQGSRRLTLRDAFAQSSNIAAVRVAQTAGHGAVVRAARDLGITSPIASDATIALGTSEVTLLQLTAAYAAVAAGRTPVRPYGLARGPGAAPRVDAPLDERQREDLLDLLQTVVTSGTGQAARLSQPVFGKTGTAQDHRDAVFVGFTGDLVVGVWVGNDDHSPMRAVTGGGMPAMIWRDFASSALERGFIAQVRSAAPPPNEREVPAPNIFRRIFGSLFGR